VKHFIRTLLLSAVVGTVVAFAQGPQAYDLRVPPAFPRPRVPADNALTMSKVELGRRLFYDTRLSGNGQQSCASCHEQARAFTDGKARAVGSTGEMHPRGAMSLVNVAYASALTWGDPTKTRLEDQALVPMFGDHPVELGLEQPGTSMLARLRDVEVYRRLFPDAFPDGADAFTVPNVTRALATFERTIISGRSAYDRYHYDRDDTAISPAARRGEQLFFSQPLSCFRCHNGFNFSGATDFEGRHEGGMPEYHNTGLYNLAGALSYPSPNTGVYEVTHRPEDIGKFKAPTLRNIAVTGPYMHDGSIASLDEVLDHYAAGGRTIAEGAHRGVGHDNPNKSPIVKGFPLTAEQKADLIAFLNALTDNDLLNDTRFANPWTARHEEAR
jgi:cytochrome c peroxidase